MNFPFETNGKLMILGVLILKHFRVYGRKGLKQPAAAERESGPVHLYTLKCFSIGTPKIINFPFVSNGKFMVFTCPNIHSHYNEAVLYLNFGTPENNEFSIWNKWKIYYF